MNHLTLAHILATLSRERSQIAERFLVRRIGVFGSFVRGEERSDSDVDILVEVDPSIGLAYSNLADYLERILEHKVDVVSTRALQPAMREIIEEEVVNVEA